MELITIGKLAKQTQHTVVALRYYEKRGLIAPAKRSDGGYRLYSTSLIPRLQFIQNAKNVGFELEEIKELLTLQETNGSSQLVKSKTQEKIKEIDERILSLQKMRDVLAQLECRCDGQMPINECPIMGDLYTEK